MEVDFERAKNRFRSKENSDDTFTAYGLHQGCTRKMDSYNERTTDTNNTE